MTGMSGDRASDKQKPEALGVAWGVAACVFLALLLVATAGRSFNAGPWRVHAVAIAAILGLAFCTARAAGVLRLALAPALRGGDPPYASILRACAGFALVAIGWNVMDAISSGTPVAAVAFALCGFGVAVLGLFPAASRTRRAARLPALLWWSCAAVAAGIHAAAIHAAPVPPIDVLDHLKRAADVLLSGANPYAQAVPDFYGGQSRYGFETPGFPYPPAVLGLASLAGALGVDVRWFLLASALATAGLIRAVALRSGWPREIAALLGIVALAVPRQSYLLTSGFSEPLSGCLLMSAIWAWLAHRRALCFALLGLFLTSKQYLLVLTPLLVLACSSVIELGWLAAGALVLWLPFVAWGPLALWHAAFGVHLGRPPRPDGLTWSAYRLASGGEALPAWIPLVSGGASAVLASLPRPATPASLCLGLATALTLTLFLSPQAFSNYYLLTSWALIGAFASLSPEAGDEPNDG